MKEKIEMKEQNRSSFCSRRVMYISVGVFLTLAVCAGLAIYFSTRPVEAPPPSSNAFNETSPTPPVDVTPQTQPVDETAQHAACLKGDMVFVRKQSDVTDGKFVYSLFIGPVNFTRAQSFCERTVGRKLLDIQSDEENTKVLNLLKNEPSYITSSSRPSLIWLNAVFDPIRNGTENESRAMYWYDATAPAKAVYLNFFNSTLVADKLKIFAEPRLVFNLADGRWQVTNDAAQGLHFVCKEPKGPKNYTWGSLKPPKTISFEDGLDYYAYFQPVTFTAAVEICQERHNGSLLSVVPNEENEKMRRKMYFKSSESPNDTSINDTASVSYLWTDGYYHLTSPQLTPKKLDQIYTLNGGQVDPIFFKKNFCTFPPQTVAKKQKDYLENPSPLCNVRPWIHVIWSLKPSGYSTAKGGCLKPAGAVIRSSGDDDNIQYPFVCQVRKVPNAGKI